MRNPSPETARFEVKMLLGCVAGVIAITLFAALTAEVREGDLSGIDRLLLLDLRVPGQPGAGIGPRWVQETMRDLSALGGFTVLTLISFFATFMLFAHARKFQAVVFLSAVALSQIASEVIKHLVSRARPMIVPHLDMVYSSSFPSGHAMMSPVVYLILASMLAAREPRLPLKIAWQVSAIALVVSIGVSRVYLGVHWPTDVLAGWLLGSVVALASILALMRLSAPIR